jgi:hypothetical protein
MLALTRSPVVGSGGEVNHMPAVLLSPASILAQETQSPNFIGGKIWPEPIDSQSCDRYNATQGLDQGAQVLTEK